MKRGTPDHPKVAELAEALGVSRATAIGHLELLFHFTAQFAPEGDIGKYSDRRIAAALDWRGRPNRSRDEEATRLIRTLVETGWIDSRSDHRLVTHDWQDHLDRTTAQRLSRHGKKPIHSIHTDTAKVCTQSETHNRTPPEPEPEPEPNHTRAHGVRTARNGFDFETRFDELWKTYPQRGRTKKPDAQRQYLEKLSPVPDPESLHREILAAVTGKWTKSETWGKGFIPGLSEFLRLERWLEDPEPAGTGAEIDYPTVAELEGQSAS